jgi:hypothetical protein
MESITFFGRLLLTPMLPLQLAVEAVEELVQQELQDHPVLLALMERQERRALLEPLEAKALRENKVQLD